MKIPYGISDFSQIREEGFLYVDKTKFIPELEDRYPYVVFLRPRRFGKSTLVSMLGHYYDLRQRDRFDELFGDLAIHAHPTAKRGSYLVLSLDFSSVATDGDPEVLRWTFVESVRSRVTKFVLRYRDRVPGLGDLYPRLGEFQDAAALIGAVMSAVETTSHRIYLLIDEYDHFANRLLAAGSTDLYESMVTKTGFVRTFFATLKSGTTSGALGRMFVTGVSPLMLDDLSSGFNMAKHASMDVGLATLAGFTRADTEQAVDAFLAARPGLRASPRLSDRDELLRVLTAFYNGYCFSPEASERVFNSDMVLYFLDSLDRSGAYPRNMLDRNVRTEYGHLQRIGTISGVDVAERRALLETIVGEGHIRSEIVDQFGVKSLHSRAPFVSLLYFLGMLTLRQTPRDAVGYDLEIPNRVIRELQWEHFALLLQETDVHINVDDLRQALAAMAEGGEIEPFLDLFHREVIQALSNRDTRGLDEKTLKLLLMTYASLGRAFHPISEAEFAQGYGDLFLGASQNVPGARFSWLLEVKYCKTGARPAQIEAAFAEAQAQVVRYASDRTLLPLFLGDRALKAGMLVFVGAKRVLYRPWDPGAPSIGHPKARRKDAARGRS